MKKIFASLLIVAGTFFSSFAGTPTNPEINQKVLISFENNFCGVADVQWSNGDDYSRADFKIHGQEVSAYFSQEGKLLNMTRQLSVSQLPLNALNVLGKKYCGYNILEIVENTVGDESTLYITVEAADNFKVVKINSEGIQL